LAEHLADWAADLAAGGATAKHVGHLAAAARKAFDGCGMLTLSDISESAVRRFAAGLREAADAPAALAPPLSPAGYSPGELARAFGVSSQAIAAMVKRRGLPVAGNGKARRIPVETAAALAAGRGTGLSARTANRYQGAVKQFRAWAVRDRRLLCNPLAGLAASDAEADRRVVFATMAAAELRLLFDTARASAVAFRGLTGADRAALYTLALYTAFRPVELRRLTPADFDLAGGVPFVRLDGKRTKNGKACDQALPPEVAAAMSDYLDGRPLGEPVWGGTWHEKAADMTRLDLTAAGLPVVRPGPDGQALTVGFYSIRHSAGLLAEANGATVREVMVLMRHSDPRLTLKTYGKLDLAGRAATVAKLPTFAAGPVVDRLGQNSATTWPEPGQVAHDGPGRPGSGAANGASAGGPESPQIVGENDDPGRGGTAEEAAPGGSRTPNLRFRRPWGGRVKTQGFVAKTARLGVAGIPRRALIYRVLAWPPADSLTPSE